MTADKEALHAERRDIRDRDTFDRTRRQIRDLGYSKRTPERTVVVEALTFSNDPDERYIVDGMRMDHEGDRPDGFIFVEQTGPDGWRAALPLPLVKEILRQHDRLFGVEARSTIETRAKERRAGEARGRKRREHRDGKHDIKARREALLPDGVRGCPNCKRESRSFATHPDA
jgi:hypothetical protein